MSAPSATKRIVVGVTGASGIVYAQRLVRFLLSSDHEVLLIVSRAAKLVMQTELPATGDDDPWRASHSDRLYSYPEKDFSAPFCSGSFQFRGMVIIPASMGTVGAVASGAVSNAIHRGADVTLKESRRLVVVPRESPLSALHLENLLKLARAGAVIIPPAPAFYTNPRTVEDIVDFTVCRVLDALGIENELSPRWGHDER